MRTLLALLLLTTTAVAQPATWEPPDEQLWKQMSEAFAGLNMPLAAHQQVQQILQSVEREARARAARAKVTPPESK